MPGSANLFCIAVRHIQDLPTADESPVTRDFERNPGTELSHITSLDF